MYDVHLVLTGKRVLDFLLVLIKLILLTVFTQRNFVADFFCKRSAILHGNLLFGVIVLHFGALEAT